MKQEGESLWSTACMNSETELTTWGIMNHYTMLNKSWCMCFRAGQIFEHKMCTTACKERGCGTLTVVDGLWKICYPLCMYSQLHDKDSFMPNVCVEAPLPGRLKPCNECGIVQTLSLSLRQGILWEAWQTPWTPQCPNWSPGVPSILW